jgi:valyl-tRNA synthetase
VIADEYVDMEFGTGALKVTPAHDVNDYELGKTHNLPLINIMNKDASINEIGGARYAGLDRFECREKLWADMLTDGLVIKTQPHLQVSELWPYNLVNYIIICFLISENST